MDSLDERVNELVARFGAPDACLAQLLCDGHDPDAAAFVVVHEDFSTETLTYGDLRRAVGAGRRRARGARSVGRRRRRHAHGQERRVPRHRGRDLAARCRPRPVVHRVRAAGDRHATRGQRGQGRRHRFRPAPEARRRRRAAPRRRAGSCTCAARATSSCRSATSTSVTCRRPLAPLRRRRRSAAVARWCGCTRRAPRDGRRASPSPSSPWRRGSSTSSSVST